MAPRTKFAATLEQDRKSLEYQAEMQFLAITEKICVAMEMRGFTKGQLARAMKVRESYITKLLSGAENLTLLTMTKVSRALGVNLTVDLMGYPDKSVFAAATTTSVSEEMGDELEYATVA